MNMAIRDANRIEAGTIEQLLASEISDVFLITMHVTLILAWQWPRNYRWLQCQRLFVVY